MTNKKKIDDYNKKQLILCILISIILIVIVLMLMNRKRNVKEEPVEKIQIATETKTELTEEELQNITTYDDYEVVNHVIISNQKAFDIYNPPINLTGNLANYLWLWLKYYTEDSQTQWHVTIDGTSYTEESDIITFSVSIDEFPNEVIECIYYSQYAYFDFYNETIMQLAKNSNQ